MRARCTTPSEVRALLPVWGQVFFLLLPRFLARLLLVESKHTGSGLLFLASPARAPCLVPALAPCLAFGGFMGLVSSLSTANLRFFSS